MQFVERRRRAPPSVIIISLIDVLIVVLIFLMVTTAFKQQPALRLSLPESKEAKPGASENALVVTISKQGPLYLKAEPVTLATLQQRLGEARRENPNVTLAIRADEGSSLGEVVKVMDAAAQANVHLAAIYTKTAQ